MVKQKEKYLDVLPAILISLDKNGNIIFVNKKGYDILEYKGGSLIGKNWFNTFIPEEQRGEVKKVFNRILSDKEKSPESHENEIITNKGKKKIIRWHNGTINDEKGQVIEIISSGQDISEQKQIEKKLKQSQRRFKEFLDNAQYLVQSVGPTGKYTYVNKKWLYSLGYDETDVKKTNFMKIISKDHLKNYIEIFKNLKQGQLNADIETRLKKKKSGEIFVRGSLSPRFDENGKMVETIGIFHDITRELKDKQDLEKFSKIVETSPSLIIMTDKDGVIEYVNPKFTEVTGYTPKETVGENPRILKSGKMKNEIYEELWETILLGKTWHGEFINKKKNDSLFYANATISGIKNNRGEIINFIAVQEDITSRKKSEEEAKKFNELAVNRELKMIELKNEINELLIKSGEKKKYKER